MGKKQKKEKFRQKREATQKQGRQKINTCIYQYP
ncbi:hypothetical protein MTY_2239 [Moorella thermoacetica Y72]|uniref:Uncharacterized protein n=1 Tax=Moorella thermoacetica Y72 TaxID=1325331 RepID=A0A0S6UGJ4_NEOTH|nr:hypothetical protein MTY_2239 [Moorella thermoacetica Y72]